jgi:hypothetical protein
VRILASGQFDLSRNFLRMLAGQGHDVAYCATGKPRLPDPAPRLEVVPVPRRDGTADVLAVAERFRPDVVYVGSNSYDGSNALARALLDEDLGVPRVRVYKEFLIRSSAREGEILRGYDGLVFHAPMVTGYFDALYGLDDRPVYVYDHDVIADELLPETLPTAKLSDEDGEPHVVIGGTMKDDGSGYDYRDTAAALADRGVHVHVYPVAYSRWLSPGRVLDPDSAQVRAAYEPLWEHPYVHREEPLPQRDQLTTWARYDAGIMQVRPTAYVPDVTPWQQMDHPSKHSYYLGAGLPVAVDTAVLSSLRRYLRPYGVTIEYDSLDDLRDRLADRAAVAAAGANAVEHRRRFALGERLPGLVEFLSSLAGAS